MPNLPDRTDRRREDAIDDSAHRPDRSRQRGRLAVALHGRVQRRIRQRALVVCCRLAEAGRLDQQSI